MKICVICVEKNDYAPKRIIEEGKKAGHKMYLTRWLDLAINLRKGRLLIGDQKYSLEKFDAIIPRSPNFIIRKNGKKTRSGLGTLLRLIIIYSKARKIPVLNEDFFLSYPSLDKLAQQFFFFKNNLPGIPTKYFSSSNFFSQENIFDFPFVAKTAQGSLGSGVFKISNFSDLLKITKKNKSTGKLLIFQKYFKIKWDYRVLVLGGRAVGVMRRVAQGGEWRTNFSLGGKVFPYFGKNVKRIKKLAEATARKMKLDYVGVDILEAGKNLHLIEVNSLAQYEGFEKSFDKINVAGKIIKLIEKKVKEVRK